MLLDIALLSHLYVSSPCLKSPSYHVSVDLICFLMLTYVLILCQQILCYLMPFSHFTCMLCLNLSQFAHHQTPARGPVVARKPGRRAQLPQGAAWQGVGAGGCG